MQKRDKETSMSYFKSFGIAARLAIGFGFLLLMMVGLTVYSVVQVEEINGNLATINDVNSAKQRFAINYRGSVHDRAIAIRDVTLVTSKEDHNTAVALIAKLAATYAENEKRMADMVASPAGASEQERTILAEIAAIQAKTNPLVADIIALQKQGDGEGARRILLERASPLFDAWLGAINKFIDYQEALNKSIGSSVRGVASGFESLALTALGIAALLSIAAAALAARSITGPLSKLQVSLEAMAGGDLTGDRRLEARRDEIGMLARAVAALRDAISAKAEREADAEATRATAERRRLEEDAKQREALKPGGRRPDPKDRHAVHSVARQAAARLQRRGG
jgi:methyl-accepting chemotaxis protein